MRYSIKKRKNNKKNKNKMVEIILKILIVIVNMNGLEKKCMEFREKLYFYFICYFTYLFIFLEVSCNLMCRVNVCIFFN